MSTSYSLQEQAVPSKRKGEVFPDLGLVLATPVPDAGNGSNDHYKSRLSPFRYKLRNLILPLVRHETDILAVLQANVRTPVLDAYFAWTANLGSHTFYVFMLPLPIWFGAEKLSRDLIAVLGLGIYLSGNLKDYMCLPRPRSPPLHRITMSSYTAQEYGFPSSHSANATAVTLILWKHFESVDMSPLARQAMYLVLVLYYISLVFGRLYCGMHGFLDCIVGSLIGALFYLFRHNYGLLFDSVVLTKFGWATPVVVFFGYVSLIHYHTEPVDDCPCFDDTVAFIGVLIGIDVAHWWMIIEKGSYYVPYSYSELGLIKSLLRVVVGVILVGLWKAVSKPIIFTILPPIYKFVGIYLPRRNFEATAFLKHSTRHIRSQSISNMRLLDQPIIGPKIDEVGPKGDIDVIEMLDYERKHHEEHPGTKNPEKPESALDHQHVEIKPETVSGVFRPRYDVEIVGRLFVYAGVASMALWVFYHAVILLHLNV